MKQWIIYKNGAPLCACGSRDIAYKKMKQIITNQPALAMLRVTFDKNQKKFGTGILLYAEEIEN